MLSVIRRFFSGAPETPITATLIPVEETIAPRELEFDSNAPASVQSTTSVLLGGTACIIMANHDCLLWCRRNQTEPINKRASALAGMLMYGPVIAVGPAKDDAGGYTSFFLNQLPIVHLPPVREADRLPVGDPSGRRGALPGPVGHASHQARLEAGCAERNESPAALRAPVDGRPVRRSMRKPKPVVRFGFT